MTTTLIKDLTINQPSKKASIFTRQQDVIIRTDDGSIPGFDSYRIETINVPNEMTYTVIGLSILLGYVLFILLK